MSESKRYYEAGKTIADGFKDGFVDRSRHIEYRDFPDHRDIGLLLYITRSDWDLLDELNRTLELTMDEIFHRAVKLYSVQAKEDENVAYWEELNDYM